MYGEPGALVWGARIIHEIKDFQCENSGNSESRRLAPLEDTKSPFSSYFLNRGQLDEDVDV